MREHRASRGGRADHRRRRRARRKARESFRRSTETAIGNVAEANAATLGSDGGARRPACRLERDPVATRAGMLERAADRLEARRGQLIALLQREGGKTLDDAIAEWREAIDFCRYYAARGARDDSAPRRCRARPGRATAALSRTRRVHLHQPWNFPLAIFLGQVPRRSSPATRARQAGRADALDRRRSRAPSASKRACRRTHCTCSRGRRSRRGARRVFRASRGWLSRARWRSRAKINRALAAQGRANPGADRGNRRNECR